MRLMVLNEAPVSTLGGIMTETRQLVAGMQGRGHRVALATDAPLDGIDAEHFPLTAPRVPRTLEQLKHALDTFRPDVVHVVFAFVGGVLAYEPLLRARPWVLTCHSTPPREWSAGVLHSPDWLHYLVRLWCIRKPTLGGMLVYGLRKPPHVIVHSATIRRDVLRRFYPARQITVIPFGHRPFESGNARPSRPKPDRSPHLLTVAGIVHTKGQHDVLSALPLLLTRYPGLTYTIVGEIRDPSYLEFLKKRVAELALGSRVEFVLSASHNRVEEAFAAADLFVQPSHEEGFCLSYLEAATRVTRLVGTETGALAAMSADDPGAKVVPVNDPAALAAAMLDVLATDLPTDHMQQRSDRLAQRFSWSAYFDEHEALYDAEMKRFAS